ncbi:hypothetical protein [Bacillus sp. 2205SS5-2]|uniref:hypothetical protein n=1 Tax=Bacillus sp. 2205SS5-2 TaxID=3109031 RepID=UPI0030052722
MSNLGLILTTLILGAAIFVLSSPFTSLTFIGSWLIAVILTPTDPVSVVFILKESGKIRTLRIL